MESLEGRLMLTVTEPNNTPATAVVVPDVYLEQQYYATDTVSSTGDQDDYFKLYTLYGPSHLYAALYNLAADADLYVYKDGEIVASSLATGSQSELLEVNLTPNSNYHVLVHAYSGNTNYSLLMLNDYAGATLATARDVGAAWGQSSSTYWAQDDAFYWDYMDYRDNVDYVKFQMEAPGTISLRRLATFGPTPVATSMELLGANGNVLANGTTDGGALNINYFAAPAGTYYVKFTQLSGAGDYTYRITADYARDVTTAARDLGNLTSSTRQMYDMVGGPPPLTTYDDAVDLYRFTFDQTAPLDVQLTIPGSFPQPTFDASLCLARDTNNDGLISAGEVLLSSTNAGNDRITTTLPAGVYYVQVEQHGAYTSYQLDFDSDFDSVPFSAMPWEDMSHARPAGALPGEVFFADGLGYNSVARDFFSFQMEAAGTLLATAQVNPSYSRGTMQAPVMTIVRDDNHNYHWDPGEELIPNGFEGFVSITLPAGAYYLVATGTGEQIAYDLRIVPDYAGQQLVNARAMASISGAAPPQQTFRDYIEEAFGLGSDTDDFYRFALPANYQVTLTTMGVPGEDLSLALIYDANSNQVVDAGEIVQASDILNSPNEAIARALTAGTYFVRVRGLNGATNYTLSMNAAQSASTAADFDSDGDVDGSDFLRWQRGLGRTGAAATKANGNADGDSDVDGADLAVWRGSFGAASAATSSGAASASLAASIGDDLLLAFGAPRTIPLALNDFVDLAPTSETSPRFVACPPRRQGELDARDRALSAFHPTSKWRDDVTARQSSPVAGGVRPSLSLPATDGQRPWKSHLDDEQLDIVAMETALTESVCRW